MGKMRVFSVTFFNMASVGMNFQVKGYKNNARGSINVGQQDAAIKHSSINY